MSLFRTELNKVGTFVYQPWSGDSIIAVIADYNNYRYLYASPGVALPISPVATYTPVELSLDEIAELNAAIIKIPEALKVIVSVYNTTDKSAVQIPTWAPCPVGYTSQVPKEFDYWEDVNNLWETDMQLRNKTLKRRKMLEINHAFETSMLAVRNDYTESEIMSWTKQEVEARRWLKDPEYDTPICDLISQARGMDKTELINKIIIKADQYAYATGLAVGRRQACEDQVNAVPVGQEAKLDQIKF